MNENKTINLITGLGLIILIAVILGGGIYYYITKDNKSIENTEKDIATPMPTITATPTSTPSQNITYTKDQMTGEWNFSQIIEKNDMKLTPSIKLTLNSDGTAYVVSATGMAQIDDGAGKYEVYDNKLIFTSDYSIGENNTIVFEIVDKNRLSLINQDYFSFTTIPSIILDKKM